MLETEENFVVLGPPPVKGPTDKASSGEMVFAGQFLNLVGLALFTLGLLSFLRVSGLSQAGWPQCALGTALGSFLLWAGQRARGAELHGYAEPLLASGGSVLFLTLGAAHFYFRLIPAPLMLAGSFALVLAAGTHILRNDSLFLASCLLLSVFGGPYLLTWQGGPLLAYLLAVNVAITVLAYQKKWDTFLIGSFIGSYLVYFHQFGISDGPTLAFLTGTYALFLLAGTVFTFVRRTASDFNLHLSLINPVTFACVSYLVLLQMSTALALATYVLIALVHGALAYYAAHLKGQGEAYVPLAQTNFSLSLIFALAAVSFLTFLDRDTLYFGPVTASWLLFGFLALKASFRLGPHYALAAKRASYAAMLLAAAQLVYVIPTTSSPVFFELVGTAAFLYYFHLHEKQAQSREEQLFGNLTLICALSCAYQASLILPSSVQLLLSGGICVLMQLAYRRYPKTLEAWGAFAYLAATFVAVNGLLFPIEWGAEMLVLPTLALMLASLQSFSEESYRDLAPILALLVVLRACWLISRYAMTPALLAAWVLAWALEKRMPGPVSTGICTILALVGLVAPTAWWVTALGGLLFMTSSARPAAVILLMKAAVMFQMSELSTLLWCCGGLWLIKQGEEKDAQVVFFLAFLKSLVDSNLGMPNLLVQLPTVAAFVWAAQHAERRDFFYLLGLLVFSFQVTDLLFQVYGILDNFQIILSGVWAVMSLLIVAAGIYFEVKLFRFFGLMVMLSCVAKIYAVDIWVLQAYDQTTTTMLVGGLLMTVSFLYQYNRPRLLEAVA